MLSRFIRFLGCLLISLPLLAAAQKTITGTVTNSLDQSPVRGASVVIKGTKEGTTTNEQGRFSITASNGQTIVVSSIGFASLELTVGKDDLSNIELQSTDNTLNSVVVVGYGTQKKANLTGAVSTVNVDEVLGNRPVSTTGALLQGTVPGLQVNINSGEPGASKSYNIRGATDIGTSGNEIKSQGPFIVVDNVPFDGPFNLLDPNDIESITVLKDAGSAAIYGARAAFGVILVTTKKGAKNHKTKFNYSNNVTLATPMSLPQKATVLQTIQSYKDMGTTGYWTGQDVDTWLELIKEYTANPAAYPDGYAIVNGNRYSLATTNSLDNLLGTNSTQFLHNLSVSGGSDKTTYRISLGTVNENGILIPESKKDGYKRYNVRSVVTSDIKDWLNVQLDASYYNAVKSTPAQGAIDMAVNYAPYTPIDDSLEINGQKYVSWTPKNMVVLRDPAIDRFDDIRLTGRTVLTPLKGLRITGEYTFDNLRNLNTTYDKIITRVEPRKFVVETNGSGNYHKGNEVTDYKSLNVYANYDKSINKHNFSLMAGYNQEESSFEQELIDRDGIISANYPSISQATGIPVAADNYSEYSVLGFFGRLNYNYAGKYLIGLAGRYDASSKFPENHRSGFFPSVSFGWSVDKEHFMEGTNSWLSQLKPRISFGSVGNQAINPYAFLPNMDASYAAWLHENSQVTTLSSPPLISSSFTWATVKTLDVGLDLALFRNRFTANIDWYQRDTKNMLYQGIQLPAVLGTGAPLQNVADLQSKGFEVQLNWQDKIGKVSYRIAANVADYRSRITRIKNEAGLISQYYVGQELGEIWGYTTDRLFTEDDFEKGTLNSNLVNGTLKSGLPKMEGELPNPGDVMFVDYNGDGIINAGDATLSNPGDRRIIGNSTPRYQYGIIGGVNWNSFDFSFVITGVAKQDQWRANMLTFPNYHAFGTLYAATLDYWTPTNEDAFWGRTYDQAGSSQKYNQSIQTKYLLNGAYFKIRNLTLGYNIPTSFTKKFKIDKFQAFFSVENVVTFDHLPTGLEPDIERDNDYGLGYPLMRSYSFGVNLTF